MSTPLTVLTPDAESTTLLSRTVGVDWERGIGWNVSYAGLPTVTISKEDFLHEPFDGYDVVIVESAHLKPRNVYSVAQVYTEDELRVLACKDKIRLFPSMPGQLAKAAREVGNVSDKVNDWGAAMPDKDKDAETLALYAGGNPKKVAAWKKFYLPDEDPYRHLWEPRDELREELKLALNPIRQAWNNMKTAEKYALPEVVDLCALIERNFDKLPDDVKTQYGIRKTRNGVRIEKMSSAITVYLSVRTRDGELRTRPDGQFIGVRFILDAIGMSGTYMPNMARSQMTHHGMRHYKGGRDGGHRIEYMRNMRHLVQFLRDAQ